MREEYVSRYVLGEDMFDIKNEYKKWMQDIVYIELYG
jgi:hypothetical protein